MMRVIAAEVGQPLLRVGPLDRITTMFKEQHSSICYEHLLNQALHTWDNRDVKTAKKERQKVEKKTFTFWYHWWHTCES